MSTNIKDFIDKQIINEMQENIQKMPIRMEKGLSLIYPEKHERYLEFLIDRGKKGNCNHIDTALDVMQALENGQSIEETASLIEEPTSIFGAKVRSVVLSWSRQGPEFFKKTLPCPYDALDEDTKKAISLLEQENETYKEREKIKRKSS